MAFDSGGGGVHKDVMSEIFDVVVHAKRFKASAKASRQAHTGSFHKTEEPV